MLKETKVEEIPSHLFSKDKKMNEKIQKQHFRSKMAQERNKLSELLHHQKPGFMEPEFEGDQTVKVR